MKCNTILFTLLLMLTTSLVTAQNVGIDESNPSEKLDVNGRIVAKGYKNTILSTESADQTTIVTAGDPLGSVFNNSESNNWFANYNIPNNGKRPNTNNNRYFDFSCWYLLFTNN